MQSTGHDTVLTEIPDIAVEQVWPGAMSRVLRNAFIARWASQEWNLRQQAPKVGPELQRARQEGDVDNAPLFFGQDAGLIDAVLPVRHVMEQMVAEAHHIITKRLSGFVTD